MNISSYNITDVGYHYIGLRVLAGSASSANRKQQTSAISRAVLKYVSDKALRLMLTEPKGTFDTVGEKICQELVHFHFARSIQKAYEITESGREILSLLDGRRHVELRRAMARVHLQTYDNLRTVIKKYLELESMWLPIVEVGQVGNSTYIEHLLSPTFKDDTVKVALTVLASAQNQSPGKIEDALREQILRQVLPTISMGVPLFRALSDRLISLRLLNVMRVKTEDCEFERSYSPCVASSPPHSWYVPLDVPLSSSESFTIYLCEPEMTNKATQKKLLDALGEAFAILLPQAGYYDLPDVRDFVCQYLRIPEAAFDEGINYLLELHPSPLTMGLRYEGVSARRKPIVYNREPVQIYNLIRKT